MSSSTRGHARGTASLALLSGEKLERRLEELLHQDRFAPPTHFVAAERVDDASLHARAELDPDAFCAEQARTLHWDEPFTTVLDDSNAPFYKWFVDGKLIAEGRALGDVTTLRDPAVLPKLAEKVVAAEAQED